MEDMKEKEAVQVVIGEYKGDKPIEVVLRRGFAANAVEPLPTKAPIKANIKGVISTPFDWLEKRVDTVDPKHAHILVNREQMTIMLVVDEHDEYKRGQIVGTVELTDEFSRFGINDPKRGWEPAALGQLIRLNRGLFEDREAAMRLVSNLKNFKAKAKSEIEKQRDPSGSMAEVYRSHVESNLPKSFTLNVALFKGTARTPIEVEFDHYIQDGDVLLQLVSPGAYELVSDFRDKCIDNVLDKIREIAPQIAIIEQ